MLGVRLGSGPGLRLKKVWGDEQMLIEPSVLPPWSVVA